MVVSATIEVRLPGWSRRVSSGYRKLRERGVRRQAGTARPDFLEKINRLSEGTWVEIEQEKGVLRCKLATIVKPGDRYVFVNRRGMKVAEKTRMQLARELQDDTLVMLNDSQVFDRALQAVIGNLRQIQSQTR